MPNQYFKAKMPSEKQLYFIALIPPDDLERYIREFKKEIKEKFDAKHALKLPAHITLQQPFSMPESREDELFKGLENLVSQQSPFPIVLDGFGCFSPRVIFVKVREHEPVLTLQKSLLEELENIIPPDKKSVIHPHMTIASRDLKKEKFKAAWEEFKDRRFEAEFTAQNIFLLKHNGKSWDILKEQSFSGD